MQSKRPRGSHEVRSPWRVDKLVVVEVADDDDGTVAISANLPGQESHTKKKDGKKGQQRDWFAGGTLRD